MVGLTSLITRYPPMLPKLNKKRAEFVLTKIDEILAWEQRNETERDTKFVELGRYLCEVRAGQYWRLENLKSFDEFLERRFPESRRKAYYLMSIHEHLPPEARKDLKAVGWTKGLELTKLARRDGQGFDCATWMHKARSMPKEEFKREVEKELTGKETEPHEILYFKVYKSQIPVIEQALETAAHDAGLGQIPWLLPGDDLRGLPGGSEPRQREPGRLAAIGCAGVQVPAPVAAAGVPRTGERESIMKPIRPKRPRIRLDPHAYEQLRLQILERDSWRCQNCGAKEHLEVHHKEFRSHTGDDSEENLITLCSSCHESAHVPVRRG